MRMSLNRKAWQRWAQERRTAKIRSARVACGNDEIASHGGVGKAELEVESERSNEIRTRLGRARLCKPAAASEFLCRF